MNESKIYNDIELNNLSVKNKENIINTYENEQTYLYYDQYDDDCCKILHFMILFLCVISLSIFLVFLFNLFYKI